MCKPYIYIEREGSFYHIMTADGMAKWKNSPTPSNTSIEMGTQVFAQVEEYFMHKKRSITFEHIDTSMATAAPRLFSPDLNTSSQQRGMWTQRVAQEVMSMGMIKLCI